MRLRLCAQMMSPAQAPIAEGMQHVCHALTNSFQGGYERISGKCWLLLLRIKACWDLSVISPTYISLPLSRQKIDRYEPMVTINAMTSAATCSLPIYKQEISSGVSAGYDKSNLEQQPLLMPVKGLMQIQNTLHASGSKCNQECRAPLKTV